MKQVTPNELKAWVDSGKDYLLIDVREDWERKAYNIGGLHIAMGSIMEQMAAIPKDKDVVLYCEKGIRSVLAIQRLEGYGYHNLINLAGGMKAWKAGE